MTKISPKLFIATPTSDGIALAPYVASIAAAVARLVGRGIGVEYRTNDGTDLILQRNLLAAEFLASDCTHLLFIDSDMTFAPDLAETLLSCRKRLIGAVYPKRSLDLERLKQLAIGRRFDEALALAHDWNVHVLDGAVTIQNGICQVAALPGGFLLIERACLEEMASGGAVPTVEPPGGGSPMRAFFREMRTGSQILDLDYAFCSFWRQTGGEVWAYPSADVRHVGDARADLPFTALLGTVTRQPGPPRPAMAEASPA